MRDEDRERVTGLDAFVPDRMRVGWAVDEKRIVVQFANGDALGFAVSLSVRAAAELAEHLRDEAHLRRPKVGRPDA